MREMTIFGQTTILVILMNNRIKTVSALLMIVFALTDCQAKMIVDNDKVKVHVVEDFSAVQEDVNSHAGLESCSVLEPMYDYVQVLEDDFFDDSEPD